MKTEPSVSHCTTSAGSIPSPWSTSTINVTWGLTLHARAIEAEIERAAMRALQKIPLVALEVILDRRRREEI